MVECILISTSLYLFLSTTCFSYAVDMAGGVLFSLRMFVSIFCLIWISLQADGGLIAKNFYNDGRIFLTKYNLFALF